MTKPLAIVFYERLMPGSQLLNRLQDLHYRVLAVDDASQLAAMVLAEKPLLLLADLVVKSDVIGAIKTIKANTATNHVPIIGFAPDNANNQFDAAQGAGAVLTVGESALSNHLSQLLDQALSMD